VQSFADYKPEKLSIDFLAINVFGTKHAPKFERAYFFPKKVKLKIN
jgi:hypothetical protein